MIRTISLAFTVLLLAGFAIAEAQAQNTKKKNPRCVPNFLEACNQRCINAGGRLHLCPQYCINKKKEYGCP